MSVRLFSASIYGIDAQLIEVELDSAAGLHTFHIVGLPDKSVEESRERITAAIRNSKFLPPSSKNRKIIVNLAPADIKKEGSAYDLPIALAYLLETEQVKFSPEKRMFIGELSLDGSLKHTSGALSVAILAKNLGFKEIILPKVNAREAAVVNSLSIIGASTLKEVIAHLDGTGPIDPLKPQLAENSDNVDDHPLLHIHGQEAAKRALVVAASGGHNLLMSGVPGAGKTLLAKALAELLPPLTFQESLEVSKIYSSLGLIKNAALISARPFRSPHHTTSAVAIVGGGTMPKPGEISLAHRGVLFLDELPEFPRSVLESLRQPLEEGRVTISRASGSISIPAKFMLVGAMNPCPCGNYGDEKNTCICAPFTIIKYRKKISGPLLDRIDIQVNVSRETITDQKNTKDLNKILKLKSEISEARVIQADRLKNLGIFSNSEIGYKEIDFLCKASPEAEKLLKQVINKNNLSLRSYHKIKKVARTVADLDKSGVINEAHMAEAVSLRIVDSNLGEFA